MQTTWCDPGEAVAAAMAPTRKRCSPLRLRSRRTATTTLAPVAREAVLQAEREMEQTIRLLDRREATVTKADMRRLLIDPVYRGLRGFAGLTPDDRVARCGCGRWCINPADHGGRADVPPPWASKVRGERPVCGPCGRRAAGGDQ